MASVIHQMANFRKYWMMERNNLLLSTTGAAKMKQWLHYLEIENHFESPEGFLNNMKMLSSSLKWRKYPL